jgi:hypothetical protein
MLDLSTKESNTSKNFAVLSVFKQLIKPNWLVGLRIGGQEKFYGGNKTRHRNICEN